MTAPLPLDDQLCFAVYGAMQALTRRYRSLLAELDLTYPQYLAMLVLWERDGLSVKEMGERLGLDSGTLTPLLKRLEAIGYVDRRRASDDERVVRVWLSARGRDLSAAAGCVGPALFGATGLSVDELVDLRGRLKQLKAALDAPAA